VGAPLDELARQRAERRPQPRAVHLELAQTRVRIPGAQEDETLDGVAPQRPRPGARPDARTPRRRTLRAVPRANAPDRGGRRRDRSSRAGSHLPLPEPVG